MPRDPITIRSALSSSASLQITSPGLLLSSLYILNFSYKKRKIDYQTLWLFLMSIPFMWNPDSSPLASYSFIRGQGPVAGDRFTLSSLYLRQTKERSGDESVWVWNQFEKSLVWCSTISTFEWMHLVPNPSSSFLTCLSLSSIKCWHSSGDAAEPATRM